MKLNQILHIKAKLYVGLHIKNNVLYIFQASVRIPKHLIRDNATSIIFQQDELKIKHIYCDHINTDMFETFKEFVQKHFLSENRVAIDKKYDKEGGVIV